MQGYTCVGSPALAATWGVPKAIRFNLQNNIIVVDTENNTVLRIDACTGIVTAGLICLGQIEKGYIMRYT